MNKADKAISISVPPLIYVSLTQKKLEPLLIFTATPRKIYDFPYKYESNE